MKITCLRYHEGQRHYQNPYRLREDQRRVVLLALFSSLLMHLIVQVSLFASAKSEI